MVGARVTASTDTAATLRLVHLTDPHLSTLSGESVWRLRGKRRLGFLSWTQRRSHLHRRDVLTQITAAVAAEHPDVIALTGDLVQIALPREVREARSWLEELSGIAEVVLVPGNHDVYQRDAVAELKAEWAPWLRVADATPASFPSVQRYAGVTLIGLCSARPEPFWSAGGELGAAQLERLDHVLGASSDSLRCVLIHHPPLTGLCPARKALRDTGALESLLARHRVEVVLYGHIHRNRDTRFGAHTRVLATASASNISQHGRASYRVLDIGAAAHQWQVEAVLKTLAEGGGHAAEVDRAQWRFERQSGAPRRIAARAVTRTNSAGVSAVTAGASSSRTARWAVTCSNR